MTQNKHRDFNIETVIDLLPTTITYNHSDYQFSFLKCNHGFHFVYINEIGNILFELKSNCFYHGLLGIYKITKEHTKEIND
jgi:hypothetical protein